MRKVRLVRQRFQRIGGEVHRIIADGNGREPLDRALQAQLQIGALVHAFQQFLVLRAAFHINPGAQKFRRAFGPFGHAAKPRLGRFHGAHRGIVAAHHEFCKGLAALDAGLAHHLDPLADDGLIGRGRAEAEGKLHGQAFQFRGNGEQFVQGRLGRAFGRIQRRDQRHELRVERVEPRGQLARAHQPQHRHGAIGFHLAEALYDAAHAARAGAGAHEDGKAHVARRIYPEIPRDDGRAIDHPAEGEAFGNEPVFQLVQDGGFVFGHFLDPDQDGADPLARRIGEPVFGEDLGLGRIEGAGRKAGAEGGIGDELGMAFPFQIVPPDGAGEMGGLGLRMGRGVAIQQGQKMRAVAGAVAVGGIDRFLEGHVDGVAGHLERGEGARVQLVHEGVAKRVICDGGHGRPACLFREVGRGRPRFQ